MKKTYAHLALCTVLLGYMGIAHGKTEERAVAAISEITETETERAIDTDRESFWRIQNASKQELKIASDNDFVVLPQGADYRLERGTTFRFFVDGKDFKPKRYETDYHVLVFYTDNDGKLRLEAIKEWDKTAGFTASSYGKKATGLGDGFYGARKGGWRRMMHRGMPGQDFRGPRPMKFDGDRPRRGRHGYGQKPPVEGGPRAHRGGGRGRRGDWGKSPR